MHESHAIYLTMFSKFKVKQHTGNAYAWNIIDDEKSMMFDITSYIVNMPKISISSYPEII